MTEVTGARARARKRDNAARLGKLQTKLNRWIDTTSGQLALLALVVVGGLLVALIGQ